MSEELVPFCAKCGARITQADDLAIIEKDGISHKIGTMRPQVCPFCKAGLVFRPKHLHRRRVLTRS